MLSTQSVKGKIFRIRMIVVQMYRKRVIWQAPVYARLNSKGQSIKENTAKLHYLQAQGVNVMVVIWI